MIPRHPGDPERLPKVSKRASGALRGSATGPVLVWGQQVLWEGGLPGAPDPAPTARPAGVGRRPLARAPARPRRAKGEGRGPARSPVSCLISIYVKGEKTGFSDANILDSARGP